MATTIQGIRLKNVSVSYDDQGIAKLEGNYELMSNSGKVLAKQGFNGYHDIKVAVNSKMQADLETLVIGVKTELTNVLGLE